MAESYYIRQPGGTTQGPYPLEKIRGYIGQGRVRADMEFSTDGETWRPGDEVPALFPPSAPVKAPPKSAAPKPAAPRRKAASGRRSKARVPADRDTRQAVNYAIASAHRGLRAMRGLFIADGVIVALVFLLALGTDSGTFKLIIGGLLLVIIVCAVYVVRFPLACAVPLAIFHTVIAAPFLLAGVSSVAEGILVGLAFVTWGCVAMAVNMQKLIKQFPDAVAAKRYRGERLGAADAGTKWQDRTRADKASQRKKLALYFGIPAVLAVVAIFAFSGSDETSGPGARTAPVPKAPLEPKLDAFRTAWNAKAADDITAFFASDLEARKSRLLAKLFRRRKWNDARPSITFERRDSVVPHQVAIFWKIADEDKVMQTDWQWEHDDWWLLDLKLRIRR